MRQIKLAISKHMTRQCLVLLLIFLSLMMVHCSSQVAVRHGPPTNREVDQSIAALKRGRWVPTLIEAVETLAASDDPRAIPVLIATTEKAHWEVAAKAALALGRRGDSRVIAPLCEVVATRTWEVAQAAADALGQIGDRAATPCLISALSHQDYEVRIAAAWNLAQLADPQALNPLLKALKDKELNVRLVAGWALGYIDKPSSLAPMMDAYHRAIKEKDSWSACAILWSFSRMADPEVLPYLLLTLERDGYIPVVPDCEIKPPPFIRTSLWRYARSVYDDRQVKIPFQARVRMTLKKMKENHRTLVEDALYKDVDKWLRVLGIVLLEDPSRMEKYRFILKAIDEAPASE